MFLRRSLASFARAYKLHIYVFFLCRYIWGLAPPPHTKKLATLLLPAFAHQKIEWPNEDGRFRPPHSLHEIAATAHTQLPVLDVICLGSTGDLPFTARNNTDNLTNSLLQILQNVCGHGRKFWSQIHYLVFSSARENYLIYHI